MAEHSRSHIPGKKSKKKIIILSIVGVVLLLFLCLGLVAYMAVNKVYDDSVPIVERPTVVDEVIEDDPDKIVDTVNEVEMEDVPIYQQVPIEDEVFNVMLVGSDSRDPERDRGRSDTMMLVSFNRTQNTATLISFLRDSLVPIEGHGQSRLNHAYSWGGIGLTINTINDNFGLDIQNYILLNFDNLEKIVDDLGGVTVEITAEESSYYAKNNIMAIPSGQVTLTGEQALLHARNRYLDSDFGRTRRQRDIMLGMYKKVMDTKSVSALSTIVGACLDEVTTNIPPNDIFSLAVEIWQADTLEIQQMAVPAEGTWNNTSYQGMAVLQMDIQANASKIQEFLYEAGAGAVVQTETETGE